MPFPSLGHWYTNQYRRSQDYCLFRLSFEQDSSLKLLYFRTSIFYLVTKTLQAILHCWKEFAPEDILLEIWAKPAPMLLRLLPAEKALSLVVSSSNPSDRFNFDIDSIEMFKHSGSQHFIVLSSMIQSPWKTESWGLQTRIHGLKLGPLSPHLSSDWGAKTALILCSTHSTFNTFD